MAEHEASAGLWAVTLEEPALNAKLDEALADIREEMGLPEGVTLSVRQDVTKNMGSEGVTLVELILVMAGSEALKAATREVTTQTVKEALRRLRDLLKAEPEGDIAPSDAAPKDDARQ